MIGTTTNEIWKDIPGHPCYQASSLGRIRRKAGTFRTPFHRILKPRIRKPDYHHMAYHDVDLYDGGVRKSVTVHSVICITFHGPRPSPKHECAHWDGDPSNNRPGNVRWATALENAADKKRIQREAVMAKADQMESVMAVQSG